MIIYFHISTHSKSNILPSRSKGCSLSWPLFYASSISQNIVVSSLSSGSGSGSGSDSSFSKSLFSSSCFWIDGDEEGGDGVGTEGTDSCCVDASVLVLLSLISALWLVATTVSSSWY